MAKTFISLNIEYIRFDCSFFALENRINQKALQNKYDRNEQFYCKVNWIFANLYVYLNFVITISQFNQLKMIDTMHCDGIAITQSVFAWNSMHNKYLWWVWKICNFISSHLNITESNWSLNAHKFASHSKNHSIAHIDFSDWIRIWYIKFVMQNISIWHFHCFFQVNSYSNTFAIYKSELKFSLDFFLVRRVW